MDSHEQLRRAHRPDDLRILFIGESPPAGGTFFYDADSVLYRATRDAFVAAIPALAHAHFLEAFTAAGCYLEDLSLAPIDKLPDRERRQIRKAGIASLAGRLEGTAPRVVVAVAKGIMPQVTDALRASGLGGIPVNSLPFPGQWHRRAYVHGLTELVEVWHRQRLLGVTP
jgi:hypothetical protein